MPPPVAQRADLPPIRARRAARLRANGGGDARRSTRLPVPSEGVTRDRHSPRLRLTHAVSLQWIAQTPARASAVNHLNNRAQLLVDGHRILPALLADLAAARREIHLSVFLFFRDPIGLEVAEVLAERARAGVDVRLLMNMAKTAMGDPFSTGEKRMMRHDPNVDYDPLDIGPLCRSLTEAGARVLDTDIDYDRIV